MDYQQLDLFSNADLGIKPTRLTPREPQLVMDAEALTTWKTTIANHQQQTRTNKALTQGTLFELPSPRYDPEAIDPFTLPQVAMSFYEMPVSDSGSPCIYFVIDAAVPLLLYVGETVASSQRWKGVHYCKDYIQEYISLHRKYKMNVAVNASFEWDAPRSRKPRQALEQMLIQKWKPPFNKEMWDLWGQPFKAD